MPLPMPSLSSLASRVVLAKHLDTRELPLHLHRQMEGYRRLEGAFTIREVEFQVHRVDGGKVSEEEREEAWQFYLDTDVGQVVRKVFCRVSDDIWLVGWAGGSTTLHLQNPVDILHDNLFGKYLVEDEHSVNIYKASYLENGNMSIVTRVETYQPEGGMTEVAEDTIGFEIDNSDSLTLVQRFEKPLPVLIFTISAPRAQSLGAREIFFDYVTLYPLRNVFG